MARKNCVILILLILIPMGLSAQDKPKEKRLGLGFGYPNTTLIFKIDPMDFKIGYDFTDGKEYLFLSGSYDLINSRQISDKFAFSAGAGVFTKMMFGDEEIKGGINLPVSLEMPLMDGFFELFAEVAPGLELFPKPAFALDSSSVWIGLTVRLG